MRFPLITIAACVAATSCVAAPLPQPRTAAAVPLFPGLALTGEEPVAEGGEVLMNENDPIAFVSGVKRAYVVAVTPEEVHGFYLGKLGGKVGYSSEDGHESVRPGGSTPVILSLDAHGFDVELGPDGRDMPGAKKRGLLTKFRKPLASGEWVQESQFQWIVRDAKGDLRSFHVSVQDEGLARDWSSYRPNTVVEITVNQFRR